MSNDYDRVIRDALAGAPEADPAPSDDEALKRALLEQADEEAFGQDLRTDNELWSEALGDENFRAHIRGEER